MLINDGVSMQEALELTGCVPDCGLKPSDPVHYGHRRIGSIDIYFISNQSEKKITVSPEFRVKQMQPEWWEPTNGSVRELPAYTQTATGTTVPVQLEANESAFIVFRKKASGKAQSNLEANFPTPQIIAEINTPWQVVFEKERRGPEEPLIFDQLRDISTCEPFDIKHYSGKITYSNTIHLPEKPAGHLFLNLHDVTAMAKVYINNQYAGGVWTPPYKVDISEYLKENDNHIKIEVTTTWMNRLIGDSSLPEKDRLTWLFASGWRKDSPLQKSGLIGPVNIEKTDYR